MAAKLNPPVSSPTLALDTVQANEIQGALAKNASAKAARVLAKFRADRLSKSAKLNPLTPALVVNNSVSVSAQLAASVASASKHSGSSKRSREMYKQLVTDDEDFLKLDVRNVVLKVKLGEQMMSGDGKNAEDQVMRQFMLLELALQDAKALNLTEEDVLKLQGMRNDLLASHEELITKTQLSFDRGLMDSGKLGLSIKQYIKLYSVISFGSQQGDIEMSTLLDTFSRHRSYSELSTALLGLEASYQAVLKRETTQYPSRLTTDRQAHIATQIHKLRTLSAIAKLLQQGVYAWCEKLGARLSTDFSVVMDHVVKLLESPNVIAHNQLMRVGRELKPAGIGQLHFMNSVLRVFRQPLLQQAFQNAATYKAVMQKLEAEMKHVVVSQVDVQTLKKMTAAIKGIHKNKQERLLEAA